jgi:carbon monoxide dehydrogenase subunit G
MPGFKRSIVIQTPVEHVFDFATDLANAHRVMPNVTKTEMLTDTGLQTGARFRETRLIKGKERSSVIEIVARERPHLHAARSAIMGMQATCTFRFAAEDSGTRVDMEAEVKGNLLWKLFLGMIATVMEKEDGECLERLKDAVEASRA